MTAQTNDLFINRELSWLDFNRRVLDLSKDKGVPIGEQLKFAAIYASNLDEFFMVRVGSLYDRTLLKEPPIDNKTGWTPAQQLAAIMPKVRSLQQHADKCVARLYEKLAACGYEKVCFDKLSKKQDHFWRKILFARGVSAAVPAGCGPAPSVPVFAQQRDVYRRDPQREERPAVVAGACARQQPVHAHRVFARRKRNQFRAGGGDDLPLRRACVRQGRRARQVHPAHHAQRGHHDGRGRLRPGCGLPRGDERTFEKAAQAGRGAHAAVGKSAGRAAGVFVRQADAAGLAVL